MEHKVGFLKILKQSVIRFSLKKVRAIRLHLEKIVLAGIINNCIGTIYNEVMMHLLCRRQ